jgi:hypothetical protein
MNQTVRNRTEEILAELRLTRMRLDEIENDAMYRFLKMLESRNFRIIIEPMREKASDQEG